MFLFTSCLRQKDVLSNNVYGRKEDCFLKCAYWRNGCGGYSSVAFPARSPLFSFPEERHMRICPIHAVACQWRGEKAGETSSFLCLETHLLTKLLEVEAHTGFYSHHISGPIPMGKLWELLYTSITLSVYFLVQRTSSSQLQPLPFREGLSEKKIFLQLQDLDWHSAKITAQIAK